MDSHKLLRVLEICLPVFGMIGLGKILQMRGFMAPQHREFINRLVYYICLPALIFIKVAAQKPETFLNLSLLVGVLVPVLATAIVFILFALLGQLKGSFAAAFVFGAYWSNTAYMGFPLAEETFGGAGLAAAALFNAICVPAFMLVSFAVIGLYGAGARVESPGARLKQMVFNPFILACILGVAASLIQNSLRDENDVLQLPLLVVSSFDVIIAFINMVAQIGLPLSLLAIGGAMHLGSIRRSRWALAVDIAGKLVLIPLISLLLLRWWFPQTDPILIGTTVLLHATPNAVVGYVIACQIGVDEGFVSAQLVLSTAFAALTIPVWIYFLM